MLYEDSAVVTTAVQRGGLAKGLSGMRHVARILHCLSSAERTGHIRTVKCTSAEQRANALTKIIAGPLEMTRAALDICGTQPALTRRLARQSARWPGKGRTAAAKETRDMDIDVDVDVDVDDESAGTNTGSSFGACAATAVEEHLNADAPWASTRTKQMLARCGFGEAPAVPSVGEQMQDERRNQRVRTGLGIPNMMLVSQAELRLAELTLQNTLANRSPVVSGTSTACDLVEELIRASRGLEVAAQAALTNEELTFIRTTQHEVMGKRLATGEPGTAIAGSKRKRNGDSSAETPQGIGIGRSAASRSARQATKRAKRAESTGP